MRIYVDNQYDFVEIFNHQSGFYLRSDVLLPEGLKLVKKGGLKFDELIKILKVYSSGEEPFMRSMPSLIDVGIMGHCLHGHMGLCKVGCYQSGGIESKPNMSVDDFRSIAEQSCGFVQQFALGGRGDPNMHRDFEEILKTSRRNEIVPNYTTSGLNLADYSVGLTAEYCGAVAVSWYNTEENGYTLSAIKAFLKKGMKTNIHYVLSKSSIEEAKHRLLNGGFPEGVNAVVFLLHKPVGQGKQENVLTNEDIKPFMEVVDKSMATNSSKIAIGFDSCCVPFVLKNTTEISPESIISCDAGVFSMYISDDMIALPCSFDQERKYGVSLRENTLQQAWESSQFEGVRAKHFLRREECLACSQKHLCKTCPILPDLNYCQA